ncbi:hypothetical protein PTE30175_03314 [Pandoraea terrae]|uniref:Transmembrane protein n=1 Tax=Pandoraea terrae TaxID=1537710 RepID=A0A5E4WMR0_9BURK|nr:hypothetical protein [Pandoraea terrae]VVE26142.1 hypothetical protein PTE30175_03314 [Pandoraea terrae]
MKAVLRTVLFLDAVLNLALGALLIASFWSALYDALQVPVPAPVLYGQLLGVALAGLAWLQFRATVNGQLTVAVASVTGHVSWISGVFILVWTIALRAVPLNGTLFVPLGGAILVIVGGVLVKLSGSVRVKERIRAASREEERERTRGGVGGSPSPDPLRTEPRVTPPLAPTVTGGVSAAPSDPESTSSVSQDARQNPHS